MTNYRGFSKRLDKLDGGYKDPDEIVWYTVPVGEEPPSEYDPAKHTIFWDEKEDARPAYSTTRGQFAELMVRVNGHTRSI
jgi:hypothetical protein